MCFITPSPRWKSQHGNRPNMLTKKCPKRLMKSPISSWLLNSK